MLTLEEITQIVRYLRAIGVKVINAKGKDLSPAEVEAIFKEAISC
jgi:hypothetical protein